MTTIYALVWRQAIVSAGHHAHSCLSYGVQPTFSSQDACEAYAAPLRQRVARTGAKRSETTVECIARIVPARRMAE
jgi:hypothetical protein